MAAATDETASKDEAVKNETTETADAKKDDTETVPSNKRLSWTEKAKSGIANIQSKFTRKNDEKEKESNPGRLSMEGLLKQARISFDKWVELHRPFNYPMPNGIVFLTSVKGAMGWGAEVGSGIVFYRLPPIKKNKNENKNENENENQNKDEKTNEKIETIENSEWSGPCAIGSGGISFGFQIGVSKIDHIIMLPARHHVRTFAC